jgi:hypothetical protein
LAGFNNRRFAISFEKTRVARAACALLNARGMVWFLERGPELIVCEARHTLDGSAFELATTVEQAGDERIERCPTPTDLIERFLEFQRRLHAEGWHVVPNSRRAEPFV